MFNNYHIARIASSVDFPVAQKINPFLAVLSSLRAHLKIFPLQRLCVSGVGSHAAPGHCLFLIRQSHYTGKESLHEFLILIIQRFRVVYHQRSFNHLYFLGIRSLSALPYRETDTPAISHMRVCGKKKHTFPTPFRRSLVKDFMCLGIK